jgi:acetyl coenzyme A synthetase (ADP forming)-like protein
VSNISAVPPKTRKSNVVETSRRLQTGVASVSVRPHYLPFPQQDSPESGRLILRDGTTATIQVAKFEDQEAMTKFFASLSDESKSRRFFSLVPPPSKLIDFFCDSSNPRKQLTLIVTRLSERRPRVIATGTYVALDETTAEVAMAVDDHFQGKGIGTLLLERLALLAVANGIVRFRATTEVENRPMLDVFRNSGFECHTHLDEQYIEVDFSVLPTESSVARSEIRDRISTAASLRPFFHPRSVAVVGASRNPNNIGTRILNAIRGAGFKGSVYPVNPKADVVASLKAYPNLRELPQAPDLVVVAVPANTVNAVIDDCAARAVRAVIVTTAGFAEIGAEGRDQQKELLGKIRGYGMRMVGPNCLGLLNTDPSVRLNASFAPDFPAAGNVAFCSQSGALGLAIIALAHERELGLSSFVSIGNKADISGNDLLQYWEEDDRTKVILLYLESFGNPRRFARIAKRISRHKPIVAVKAGRTGAGRRAAGSHTAALAADDVAVDALFHQTGVIRAETLGEMFDLALTISSQPLPRGRRVAILTNAGGLGILCADACEANGLVVQQPSAQTKRRLREFLSPAASVENPVDMIASASADDFRRAVEILLCADEADALIVLTIHIGLADIAAISREVRRAVNGARTKTGAGKPVLTCIVDGEPLAKSTSTGGEQLPNLTFPESAARVLSKLSQYAEWRDRPEGMTLDFDDIRPQEARAICEQARRERGASWLSGEETRKVLSTFALPVPAGGICPSADEATKLAAQIGFPVALKLASRTIVHKTEFGGVRLNLGSEAAVRQAFLEIQQRVAQDNKLEEMDGVLIQPMISDGVEVMVGMTLDPLFGPLIGFGLGGIHVEILKDVCFRVTPITDRDAAEMVRSIKGYRLLEGYRGHPPADIAAIEDLLLRVARLVEEVPEIAELDLNPVIALPPGQGCKIVDARIRV